MTANSVATYPLRLPHSIRAAVERISKQDGTSINQFVNTAVAKKLAAMATAEYFEERRNRADFVAFDRLMSRSGGAEPQAGDEIKLGKSSVCLSFFQRSLRHPTLQLTQQPAQHFQLGTRSVQPLKNTPQLRTGDRRIFIAKVIRLFGRA